MASSMTPQVWDRPADRIRNDAETFYSSVRSNPDLTVEAKRARIAKRYLETKNALDAMNTANPSARAAELAAAKRAAFGIDDLLKGASQAEMATMAMSFRDAQQRAAQLSSDREATDLLDTANQSGDELLARAIGNQALSGFGFGLVGFDAAAASYLDAHPDQAAALQRVNDLQRMPDFATLVEFVAPVPREVDALSAGQLAALARSGLA